MITFLPDLNGRYPEDKELFFKELPDEPELYNPLPGTSSSYEEGKVDTVYNLWLSDTTMGYALDDITSLAVKMKNFHDSRKEVQESKCKVKEDEVIKVQSNVEMKKAECAKIPDIIVEGTSPGATKSFPNPRNKVCNNLLQLKIENMKAISRNAIRCRFAETIQALDYFTKQSVFWGFIATAQLG